MLVVNMTSEEELPAYQMDSPDSSWVRALAYLYEVATGLSLDRKNDG